LTQAGITSEECRDYADEAEALARQMSLQHVREELIEEAISWRERAERMDRGSDNPQPS
jgi:hypothetical protein